MEHDDGEWRGPSPSAPPPPDFIPLPPLPEESMHYYYEEAENQLHAAYEHREEEEPLRREPLVQQKRGVGRFLVDLNIPANHVGILEHSFRPWSPIIALVFLMCFCLFTGAICFHCLFSDDPPEGSKHPNEHSLGGGEEKSDTDADADDNDNYNDDDGCSSQGASCFSSLFVACVAIFVAYNGRHVVFQFNDNERHILVQEKRIIRRLCDPCGLLGMASRPSSLREFQYDNVAGFGIALKPMRRENHERLADVTINMHSGESIVLMTSTLTNANHFCDELITYWQYRP
jgi:hypothetical protein